MGISIVLPLALVLAVPVADAPVVTPSAPAPASSVTPQKEGGLSRQEIMRVFNPAMPRIKRCYDVALAQRSFEGRTTAFFHIGPAGDVIDVELTTEHIDDEGMKACIVAVIGSLKFPSPRGGGVVNVTYPFVFTQDESQAQPEPTRPLPPVDNEVSKAVAAAHDRFEVCMTSRPEPEAIGRLTAVFSIDVDGKVSGVEARDSNLRSTAADRCVVDVVTRFTFAPGQPRQIVRELIFIPPPPPKPSSTTSTTTPTSPKKSTSCLPWPFSS